MKGLNAKTNCKINRIKNIKELIDFCLGFKMEN